MIDIEEGNPMKNMLMALVEDCFDRNILMMSVVVDIMAKNRNLDVEKVQERIHEMGSKVIESIGQEASGGEEFLGVLMSLMLWRLDNLKKNMSGKSITSEMFAKGPTPAREEMN